MPVTIRTILEEFKPEGIRVIVTYRCNKRCDFCFQVGHKSPILEPEKLDSIFHQLSEGGLVPTYITYQGGELAILNEATKYFEVGQRWFPQVFRQSLTTNGTAKLGWYKKCKMYGITHFTVSLHEPDPELEKKVKVLASDGFFAVRVNCYIDKEHPDNIRHVYQFCQKNNVQLTLCEDLRTGETFNSVEYLADLLDLPECHVDYHKHQSVVRVPDQGFMFWIYKHLDNYDYNNVIVLPDGSLSMTFDDVLKGAGCDPAWGPKSRYLVTGESAIGRKDVAAS